MTDFYISATGSNTNPGTQSAPWLTHAYAQTTVRAYLPTQSQDINIHTLDTVRIASALALTSADNGQNGYKVTWADGTLNGGVVVTGWSLWDAGKNIYRTAYAGVNPRAIWIDGTRCYRSRVAIDATFAANAVYSSTGFTSSGGYINGTRNVGNVEFIWHAANGTTFQFDEPRNKVVSAAATTITMLTPSHTLNHTFMGGGYFNPTHIENLYENFYANATQGTFYFDEGASFLYYCPRTGENLATATITAPVIDGSFVTATGASNIDIRSMICEYGNWTMPDGFAEASQNNFYTSAGADAFSGLVLPPSAIYLSGCTSCNVLYCITRHLSAMGIRQTLSCVGCEILRNTVSDTACNGIALGETAEGPLATCCDGGVIQNNTITDIGQEFKGAGGIVAPFMVNGTLDNNTITNTPYNAISIGFGLDAHDSWSSKNGNSTASQNRIDNTNYSRSDGAAIYVQAPQHSLTADGNYATTGTGALTSGSYMDQGTGGTTFTNLVSAHFAYTYEFNSVVAASCVVGTGYSDTSSVLVNGTPPSSYVAPSVSGDPAAAAPAIVAAAGVEPLVNDLHHDNTSAVRARGYVVSWR